MQRVSSSRRIFSAHWYGPYQNAPSVDPQAEIDRLNAHNRELVEVINKMRDELAEVQREGHREAARLVQGATRLLREENEELRQRLRQLGVKV